MIRAPDNCIVDGVISTYSLEIGVLFFVLLTYLKTYSSNI